MGRHAAIVPYDELVLWLKLEKVEEYVYVISVTLPKLCILALYLRIFTTKGYRRSAYAIGGIVITNCVACIIVSCAICRPFAYNWDKLIADGYCGDLIAVYRWVSIPNLLTDIAMLVLPLPVIWHLHTGLAQKVGLTITFLTGSM